MDTVASFLPSHSLLNCPRPDDTLFDDIPPFRVNIDKNDSRHDSLFAHPYRQSAFVPCLFLVCEYLVHLSTLQHTANFRYLYSITFGGIWDHLWGLDSIHGLVVEQES
jgi:hypothetical protein